MVRSSGGNDNQFIVVVMVMMLVVMFVCYCFGCKTRKVQGLFKTSMPGSGNNCLESWGGRTNNLQAGSTHMAVAFMHL
jgi:hypothetical protein